MGSRRKCTQVLDGAEDGKGPPPPNDGRPATGAGQSTEIMESLCWIKEVKARARLIALETATHGSLHKGTQQSCCAIGAQQECMALRAALSS
eukprot:1150583-Pelagomonas_calceolata.AAC.4